MELFNRRPDVPGNADHVAGPAGALLSDVNRIAVALAAMPSSEDLPRYLTRQLKEDTNAYAVTFTEYDRSDKTLVPVCVEGNSTFIKKALALIGKKLPEIRSPISDNVYKEITSTPVGLFYSLNEVTFGAISKAISTVLMKMTGTERFYGLAYVIEGELFGTSMIVLKKDQPDPPREYLDSFAYLAAVSLRRMRADQERYKSEERFSAVFRQCPIGITISRLSDGFIVDVNDALLSLLEYSREDVIGVSAKMLPLWADGSDRPRFMEQVQQGFVHNFETEMRTKSGRIVEVTINSVVIFLSGEKHIMNFVEDVTERKRGERERKTLEQQLIKSQRLESIGTLAGGIAHDFNNLLAMLLGNAELLKMHLESDPAMTKYIDRIIDVSSRGASITKQLLLFSRHSEVALQPVSLTDLIVEVQTMLVHFIPKSITVKIHGDGTSHFISADAGLIHQVVLNLCLNAKDAMPGGGTLTLAEREIDASVLREKFGKDLSGPYVVLDVSDTGIGIDERHLGKIFDPFFTTKEIGKGTGLGLSIVHGIMKSHNGFIDVQSVIDEGTTFTLYFPAIAPPVPINSP
jgi:PAS domain S-box-containing protein